MNDFERELLERAERLERGAMVFKEAVLKVINGEVIDGTPLEQILDDVLFEENYSVRKDDCITEVGIIIEHLLKLKYCTNDRNHKVWINSIETHRGTLYGYVQWLTRKPVTRLIKYIEENLEESYITGINLYVRAAKKYPDLKDGLSKIPEECPWNLEELMDKDIDELLNILNDNILNNGGKENG